MIKYKGFPVAPAEVESLLLEHPAVRDCGVVAKPDLEAGEIPCSFVVLHEGFTPCTTLHKKLRDFFSDRPSQPKQPPAAPFLDALPPPPSAQIWRLQFR